MCPCLICYKSSLISCYYEQDKDKNKSGYELLET